MPPATRGDERLRRALGLGLFIFAGANPFSITLSQSGLAVAYGSAAALMVRRRGIAGAEAALHLPFLGYALVELIAAALSIDRPSALVHAKRLLLLPVAYAVAEYVRSDRDLGRLAAPFLFSTTILSGAGIARYLLGPGGLEDRLRFTHYMTTSGLLVMAICLAAGTLLAGAPRRWRIPLAVSVAANGGALLFTFTRSAWLGLAAGLGLMLGAWRRIALLPYAAALAAAAALSSGGLRERFFSSFHPDHVHNVERVRMWAAGLRIWRDRPWFGVGDVGTGEVYRQYMSTEARELAGHFHSNPVHLLVTLGLAGWLAVGWLTWRIARYERQTWLAARGAGGWAAGAALASGAILLAFHVAGLFEWNLGDAEVATFLWFSVGLSIAARRVGATSA